MQVEGRFSVLCSVGIGCGGLRAAGARRNSTRPPVWSIGAAVGRAGRRGRGTKEKRRRRHTAISFSGAFGLKVSAHGVSVVPTRVRFSKGNKNITRPSGDFASIKPEN